MDLCIYDVICSAVHILFVQIIKMFLDYYILLMWKEIRYNWGKKSIYKVKIASCRQFLKMTEYIMTGRKVKCFEKQNFL